MYPDCHQPKSRSDKVNCGTCRRWDRDKRECKDKALHYAEWEEEHRWAERMMQGNRGVRMD